MFLMHDVPRSKIFDDIYFSVEDARAETEHVFLKGNRLPERFEDQRDFIICETGFGTGLNFLMAWEVFREAGNSGTLHFTSFEKYPMNKQEIKEALQPYFQENILAEYLDKYPNELEGWKNIQITDDVKLTLIFDDVNSAITELEQPVDAWFLDGFAPAKNPEMWSETLFQNMARLSHERTTFATFTAAGVVRRGLEANGFQVDKVKGFGKKRDMIKGHYLGN